MYLQLKTPGFLTVLLHKQYGDEGDEGYGEDDEEDEKALPDFKEGDNYRLFSSGSKKVTRVFVNVFSIFPVNICYH